MAHQVSDFSDNVVVSPRLAKAIHVVTPYGKFENNLHLYEFEVVGEELVVYPLDGSGGSFHYRGSFLYYMEGEYRRWKAVRLGGFLSRDRHSPLAGETSSVA